jgi:periplasmic protein TonB
MKFRGIKVPLRGIAVGLATAAVLIGLGVLIYRIFTGTTSVPRKTVPDVVQLKLIPPPPPPPPPPPKMVEQPKMKQPELKPQQVVENHPPSPKAPTPPGPPALDVKGQGPSDSFGLQGNPGGGDFLGGGGGGGGSRFGWYAALIEGRAREALQKERRLIGARYQVAVRMWLSSDGVPQRVELIGSTGKTDTDRLLQEVLQGIGKLPQPPPQDMPQPVILQVSTS